MNNICIFLSNIEKYLNTMRFKYLIILLKYVAFIKIILIIFINSNYKFGGMFFVIRR